MDVVHSRKKIRPSKRKRAVIEKAKKNLKMLKKLQRAAAAAGGGGNYSGDPRGGGGSFEGSGVDQSSGGFEMRGCGGSVYGRPRGREGAYDRGGPSGRPPMCGDNGGRGMDRGGSYGAMGREGMMQDVSYGQGASERGRFNSPYTSDNFQRSSDHDDYPPSDRYSQPSSGYGGSRYQSEDGYGGRRDGYSGRDGYGGTRDGRFSGRSEGYGGSAGSYGAQGNGFGSRREGGF